MIMAFPVFLFEAAEKTPTVAYMYGSGTILALIVFAATYFHRQIGLIVLILVGFFSFRDNAASDIAGAAVSEAERNYINHWQFSSRLTLILSALLFYAAIILKRKLKKKKKLD